MHHKSEQLEDSLGVELTQSQQERYASLIPLLQDITQRVAIFHKGSAKERQEAFSEYDTKRQRYGETLVGVLAECQRTEAARIKTFQLSSAQLKEKELCVEQLNDAIFDTASFLAFIDCSMINAQ